MMSRENNLLWKIFLQGYNETIQGTYGRAGGWGVGLYAVVEILTQAAAIYGEDSWDVMRFMFGLPNIHVTL